MKTRPTTKTTSLCLGYPVRFDARARAICEARGIGRWKKIVVGPLFQCFPPGEQQALLLHEAAHCRMGHVRQRLFMLLTQPWRVAQLCREQEYAADQFVRAAGCGIALANAFLRLTDSQPRTALERVAARLHPPRADRVSRLI